MFKILALLGLALVSPTCFAASVFNVQSTFCSGIQTSSLNSPLSLNCTGDLALDGGVLGGVITDSAGINLSATGTLTLNNLTITAPQIQLAGSSVFVGNGVSFAGGLNMPFAANVTRIGSLNGAPTLITPTGTQLPSSGMTPISRSGTIYANAGTLSIANGGALSINAAPLPSVKWGIYSIGGTTSIPPVPEPGIYATMLIGLLFLAGFLRTSRYKSHFAA